MFRLVITCAMTGVILLLLQPVIRTVIRNRDDHYLHTYILPHAHTYPDPPQGPHSWCVHTWARGHGVRRRRPPPLSLDVGIGVASSINLYRRDGTKKSGTLAAG